MSVWRAASVAARSSADMSASGVSSGASCSSPEKVSCVDVNEIDDAGEHVLGADGQLQQGRPGAQPRAHLREDIFRVGADAIHLVDEGDARHAELVRLVPHGLRLGLDPVDGAEHHDRAVEHPQGALDLDGEVDVAGRVDEVQLVLAPVERGGRGGDGDAALTLLRHPVHLRVALVDLADLVDASRVEQESFGHGGLASVDMGDDTEVTNALELHSLSHAGRQYSKFRPPWSRAVPLHSSFFS